MSDDEIQPYAAAAPHHTTCSNNATDLAQTAFRLAEKRYKLVRYDRRDAKRRPIPELDMKDVVDMRSFESNSDRNRKLLRPLPAHDSSQGATPLFAFDGVPGIVLMPNALTEAQQLAWSTTALDEFSQSSLHPNNITTLDPSATTSGYVPPMRWATLGFSYDWTSKTYSKASYSSFPAELRGFSQDLVSRVDGPLRPYQPQTAIVNYFPVGTMMMAHQDVSEVCLNQPLVSISLGCSSIFLMGTESRNDEPFAFILRSGDAVLFDGPSRVAYHAVPRIFDDLPEYFAASSGEPKMRSLRININVRQVFSEPCNFLFDERINDAVREREGDCSRTAV